MAQNLADPTSIQCYTHRFDLYMNLYFYRATRKYTNNQPITSNMKGGEDVTYINIHSFSPPFFPNSPEYIFVLLHFLPPLYRIHFQQTVFGNLFAVGKMPVTYRGLKEFVNDQEHEVRVTLKSNIKEWITTRVNRLIYGETMSSLCISFLTNFKPLDEETIVYRGEGKREPWKVLKYIKEGWAAPAPICISCSLDKSIVDKRFTNEGDKVFELTVEKGVPCIVVADVNKKYRPGRWADEKEIIIAPLSIIERHSEVKFVVKRGRMLTKKDLKFSKYFRDFIEDPTFLR